MPARALPEQRTLLIGLLGGRLALALATLVAASLVWTSRPDVSFFAAIGVIIALVLAAYAGWLLVVREQPPGRVFLTVQGFSDIALVVLLNRLAGSGGALAAGLFVLVIAAYAVVLPARAGGVVAFVAAAAYVADTLLRAPAQPAAALWGQLVVFSAVFAVVTMLARRLRDAGVEHATLEHEIARIRFEAGDVLQHISSGVLTVAPDGRLAHINPMGERLLALDRAVVGQPVLDALKQRSSELWAAVVAGIRRGQRIRRGEGVVMGADGSQFPIGLTTTTFQQAEQDAPSVTAIFSDISDSKRLSMLHLRTERLEAVAALSASLAHEIRNPLASIRSSVEQLARSRHTGEDEKVLMGLVVRETDRLSRLLSEFLDFSRVRVTRSEPLDLHALVTAVARLVATRPECEGRVEFQVEGSATVVEGDEDLLHRAVQNLLLNAAQSSAEPVRVTVAVGPVPESAMPPGLAMPDVVRLQVRDTGPGIPEEIRDRLFEPFVTRRAGGSGLGLAIVQRAVEAHRGTILVESGSAGGTTFTIYLPATRRAEDAA